jgi:Ca2+-binding EF-hand superfamily protein
MCDTDGSGQVTHRELFRAMTENAHEFPVSLVAGTHDRAGVSARITELDRDNDRSLSFTEFARALVRFA